MMNRNPGLRDHFDPKRAQDKELLKDDREFLRYVEDEFAFATGGSGGDKRPFMAAVRQALAETALSTLSVEERSEILQAMRGEAYQQLYNNTRLYNNHTGTFRTVELINKLSNNQGYTGPDAARVGTTIATKNGGIMEITRGQLLDNENFSVLLDQVFVAAGGTPDPNLGKFWMMRGVYYNMPSSFMRFGGSGPLGIDNDMKHWSESERIEFLEKVAEFGNDGVLSGPEGGRLAEMVKKFDTSGESEQLALTGAGGKFTISKDDVMKDGTFKDALLKQLSPIGYGSVSGRKDPLDKLSDLIAKADYSKLSYGERVALLLQVDQAKNSGNKFEDYEIDSISTALTRFLQTDENCGANAPGKTLSNGTFVADAEVATDDHFASLVQRTLQRSNVTTSIVHDPTGNGPYEPNNVAVMQLMALDVTDLTPKQRLEILAMISNAGADSKIDSKELSAIHAKVDELSGRLANPMHYYV